MGVPFAWSQTVRPTLAPADTTQKPAGPIGRVVQVLNADRAEGSTTGRTLMGNVRLQQGNTYLWAQSVQESFASDLISLSGAVRLVQNGDTLTARKIVYNTRSKQAVASGDLRLSNGKTRIFTDTATYDAEIKLVHFTVGARIVDSTTVITARKGVFSNEDKWGRFESDVRLVDGKTVLTAIKGSYNTTFRWGEFEGNVQLADSSVTLAAQKGVYYRDLKEALFFGNVRIQHPDFYMEADSLTSNRKSDTAFARGHVFMQRIEKTKDGRPDSLSHTFLFGRQMYHQNKIRYTWVQGKPLVVQLKTDPQTAKTDTLFMASRKLEVRQFPDDSQQMNAFGGVTMWRGSFSAKADSVAYLKPKPLAGTPSQDRIRLFRKPIVWAEGSQITGDTLRLHLREGKPDSLFVDGNAFVARMDSLIQKINQLSGKKMVGQFEQDSLRTLFIQPQAELIYFTKDDQKALSNGIRMQSQNMRLTFQKGELSGMDAVKPQGSVYDIGILPEPFQLQGFLWLPDQRPEKSDFNLLLEDWARIQARLQAPTVYEPRTEPTTPIRTNKPAAGKPKRPRRG